MIPWGIRKAFEAFALFKDLGAERSYARVAERLKKSTTIIGRWGKRHNWHNRALDFDENNEGELQRRLLARRSRARERALETAEIIDEKLVQAVRVLQVTKIVKVDGKRDEETLGPTGAT